MGVEKWGGTAALARRGLTMSPMHRGIEVSRGGLDAALPWVQYDVAHARHDKCGNPNHTILAQEVFVDATNHMDAERQGEHNLAKKKRAKLFFLFHLHN